MADYFPKLAKRVNNVMFMRDGTVWANYLLRGINTNPYQEGKISACQEHNELLFNQLSRLQASDFLLLGIKAQTPPRVIMDRCVAGIPGLSDEGRYPQLLGQYNAFYNRILSGEYAEYQRVYWLSIAFPTPRSWSESLLSSAGLVDPHRGVNGRKIKELEDEYFRALPAQFTPARTTPDHVRWVFDRVRQRGIVVPHLPDPAVAGTGGDGPRSFAEVMINKNGDTEALFERLVAKVGNNSPAVIERGRRILAENFRAASWARALSVHNTETRCAQFPDGYTSYQSQLAIARYPSSKRYGINTFTNLVDQKIGVDADFALRFDFDQTAISKEGMQKAMRELKAEAASNTRDEFDAEDYADQRSEMRDFRRTVKEEAAAVGMRVAAVFSFSHQNREFLNNRVDALYQKFVNNDFTPLLPARGQYDLWQAMMPGSPCPSVLEDLKQESTTRLFSGLMPVRRTWAGDAIGVPIMINKENELGQIVHLDILNATDRGNGSMAFTGAPNKGKSNLTKKLLAFMIDLRRYAHVIDQSKHGEYVVFAQTFTAPEIVDVFDAAEPRFARSLDSLKCFPFQDAASVFMDQWLPLMKLSTDDEEATLLSTLLAPDYRRGSKIFSTRDLLDHLPTVPGDASRTLQRKLTFWSKQPYAYSFIDPVINGQRVNVPAFNSQAHCVIFRTHKLSLYRPGNVAFEDAEPGQRFAAMAYTAIARLTEQRFAGIKGICGFFGDELQFLEGSAVLQRLIEMPDATGRKDSNLVIAAAQLPRSFDKHYALIKKKVMFGQETRPNAEAALTWGDVPATQKLISRMVDETSPLDPERNNLPRIGEEGQCWYNDGINIIRGQALPQLRADRRRFADTTSSRMIRASELRPQHRNGQRPSGAHGRIEPVNHQ